MHTIITIEGNIKSGKTELFNKMYEKYKDDDKYIFINIDDDFDNFFLKKMSEMNTKYNILSYIFNTIKEDKVIFMKTSFEFDKNVNIPLLYETGTIGDNEKQLYENMYDNLNLDQFKSNLIFYLKVKPKKCKSDINITAHCNEIINEWLEKKDNVVFFNSKYKKLIEMTSK